MPGITGQGDTFDLPNFVGELFGITPADTPFLSAVGGLTGGEKAVAKDFQWQGSDLRAAAQNVALEGANAPEAQERARFSFDNVVEVHQEAIEVSYTKQAAVGQLSGVNIQGANPVTDEIGFQVGERLKEIGRDIEFGFIQGTFIRPTQNNAARHTRGILEAIEALPTPAMDAYAANVIDAQGVDLGGTPAPGAAFAQSDALVLNLMQMVWENGGLRESEGATLIAGAWQKRRLTDIFVTAKNYQQTSRNVGGVSLQTLETDFGLVNLMLNRHMPADVVAVVSMDQCAPVFLEIPGKGFLFVEPLAKVGAAERRQIYGEVGLKYGNPLCHGKIENLSVGFGASGS